ncbi:fructokinase [Novosphingobium sp. SG751A]|uniref:ROK family protein n=1 Tax=Novosphingobium sp. SG751A TaxID=2587000 RepID=UPI001C12ADE7|nr:ROK family protein [Novosphingobium sp. SG751A]NOW48440.1 fructokinase [Novosphingobium sp. SG751A]
MSAIHTSSLFGAIEAGGTKILCGIGDEHGSRETLRIATTDPESCLAQILSFFRAAQDRHGAMQAVGLASFGPVDLDRASSTWGHITTTPKPGWRDADLRGAVATGLGLPVAVDTDVNAAALAEAAMGAAVGCQSVAYITVGTGIGVGLTSGGRTVSGRGHPEVGHILPRRHAAHEGFAGICPYHGDCYEGLASGPAIIAAWGGSLAELPQDHPAWAAQADYLGQLCASLILTVAPEHIVIGGGVMAYDHLLADVRRETARRLAGYASLWASPQVLEARITAPGCQEAAGLVGAYLLARGEC